MRNFGLAVAAMGLAANAASAQDVVYWAAPRTSPAIGEYYFPMGTAINLATRTQISTKDNKSGDKIYFDVAESLLFRGQVVVPAGSVAVGEVSRVQRNRHFGRKGKLEIRLLYVQTPHGPVRLSGSAYDEGVSGTAASVATMLFVSGLGFLIHGTSGYIQPGAPVQAYLADPLRFTLHSVPANDAVASVSPATARQLPATFDPSVFGGIAVRSQ
jgi:hypothetical protein